MTLRDFNVLMTVACNLRKDAKELEDQANRVESVALRLAGIEHVDRESGFPCWRIAGMDGWFNAPYLAIEAKEGKK